MKRKFCIAPMMKKTDKHFRFLSRLLSKNAYLYTEMIHSNAIIKGDKHKLLSFNNFEQPVALQLGGSSPKDLGIAANIGEDFGYSEINLNVGCPSKKVRSGNFGVFLMKDSNLLSDCLYEMKRNVSLPVTVKCRIGVDEFEGKDFLFNFVNQISNVGVKTFIIHARKAISGLDTKRNRSIPKLNYKIVKDLKEEFPELEIILNGGIDNLKECKNLLNNFDGIMLGRKIYDDPLFLLEVQKEIFNNKNQNSLKSIMNDYLMYVLSLSDQKDINRALNHFMQLIKVISKNKNVRYEILNSLKNKDISIENIFINLKEDLLRKDLALSL
jgi:tRNA-dihydrouridine synthase A